MDVYMTTLSDCKTSFTRLSGVRRFLYSRLAVQSWEEVFTCLVPQEDQVSWQQLGRQLEEVGGLSYSEALMLIRFLPASRGLVQRREWRRMERELCVRAIEQDYVSSIEGGGTGDPEVQAAFDHLSTLVLPSWATLAKGADTLPLAALLDALLPVDPSPLLQHTFMDFVDGAAMAAMDQNYDVPASDVCAHIFHCLVERLDSLAMFRNYLSMEKMMRAPTASRNGRARRI